MALLARSGRPTQTAKFDPMRTFMSITPNGRK